MQKLWPHLNCMKSLWNMCILSAFSFIFKNPTSLNVSALSSKNFCRSFGHELWPLCEMRGQAKLETSPLCCDLCDFIHSHTPPTLNSGCLWVIGFGHAWRHGKPLSWFCRYARPRLCTSVLFLFWFCWMEDMLFSRDFQQPLTSKCEPFSKI